MSDESNKYVLFEVAGTTYGLSSSSVHHIEMVEHITAVPNANPAIDGVVFSRGQVLPVLSLRTRFGLPRQPHDMRTRLVFVQTGARVVGLVVDLAREFMTIPSASIRPIEQTLTGINGNYLRAVVNIGERLILLLDLEAVLDVSDSDVATLSLTEHQKSPQTKEAGTPLRA